MVAYFEESADQLDRFHERQCSVLIIDDLLHNLLP